LYNKYCEYFGGYVCAVFMNSDTWMLVIPGQSLMPSWQQHCW